MTTLRLYRYLVLVAVLVAGVGAARGNTIHVSASTGSDGNDGSDWSLAKQTIQAGVDAAGIGDTVLVSNGTYNTGGRVPPGQFLCQTRVVIDKAISVASVNGPSNTWIVGQGPRGDSAVRCVWMTNNTLLSGFTLTNGYTAHMIGGADEKGGGVFGADSSSVISNVSIQKCAASDGGGAYSASLYDCTISGTSATNNGGGTHSSTLVHCTISSSSATNQGGGAYSAMLANCTLIGNKAFDGGGAMSSALTECTISGNSCSSFGGGTYLCNLTNCIVSSNTNPWVGGGVFGGRADGCTISGNSAKNGGGSWGVVMNGCDIFGNSAVEGGGGVGGGSILTNCNIFNNSAKSGGGASAQILVGCTISSNSATLYGAGVNGGTLTNCTLIANTGVSGGGAYQSTLYNCLLVRNTASSGGGGAMSGNLYGCTIVSNSTANYGGGTAWGTIEGCVFFGNSATGKGGGAYYGTLNNCALSGNRSDGLGGGAHSATLNNCTVYANTNHGVYLGTARNTISCSNTVSDLTSVTYSVCYTNNPVFVDAAAGNLRLQSNSPCINAGINAYAPINTPYDLDGNPRIAQLTVDIGAYEFQGTEFFDLWASAGPHGSIVPAGTVRTNQGASVVFTMLPDLYYHVANVTSNGVGVGSITNFTWSQVSAAGTVTVSFAESTAAHGTPLWWLAQYGWTQNLDVVETDDPDDDGLLNWQEYNSSTSPTNANTDGDQFNDGIEVQAGADPLRDDTQNYAAMLSNPAAFGLYTSNSVVDLSFGEMMLSMVTNTVKVRLTLMTTDTLGSTNWNPVGASVEWSSPVVTNKGFFRFLGEASQ